jgi:branched-chain amino acid transport system permease protein
MNDLLVIYIIPGLVIGCVYAIAASGLVVTYSTSGVLNLAYGAIAFATATFFNWLRVRMALPGWPALLICVLGFCPLLGILLWRYLFRPLAGIGLIPPLIASIALTVILPPLCAWILKPGEVLLTPGITNHGAELKKIGSIAVSPDQLYAVGGAVVIGAFLFWLLRLTSTGLKMRAVFDDPGATALTGASPGAVSTFSWALATALAGLGGILLAPVLELNSSVFLQLTVASLAAALVGGLRSISITFIAALLLGLSASVIAGLDTGSGLIATAIQPTLPFLLILIVLFARRRPIEVGQLNRVIKGALPSPRPLASTLPRVAPVAVATLAVPLVFSDYWTGVVGLGLIYGVIFLPLIVAIGDGGMVTLGQGSIIGIGGFFGGLVAFHHAPLLIAILAGGLMAAAVGGLLAFVGGRLGALEFALLTLAFGLVVDNLVYEWRPLDVGASNNYQIPGLFGLSLATPTEQYYLFAVTLGLALIGVWLFRRTMTCFYAWASRMNPTAVEATGVGVRAVRVITFAFASSIGGVGVGLLGVFQKHLGPEDLTTATGLLWLTVIVCMGIRSPTAAVIGGMVFALLPALVANYLPLGWGYLPTILFGLGALGLASDPRGIVSLGRAQSRSLLLSLQNRRATRPELGAS